MELKDIGSTKSDRVVKDIDITFVNGFMMSITLDTVLGDDMVQEGEDKLIVVNVARASSIDPDNIIPEEKTTIYLKNVMAIQERYRVVVEANPEEKAEWVKALKELTNQGN